MDPAAPPVAPAPTAAGRWRRAAALAAVLVLAAAVRLATWPWVLGGPEVRIVGDGDVRHGELLDL